MSTMSTHIIGNSIYFQNARQFGGPEVVQGPYVGELRCIVYIHPLGQIPRRRGVHYDGGGRVRAYYYRPATDYRERTHLVCISKRARLGCVFFFLLLHFFFYSLQALRQLSRNTRARWPAAPWGTIEAGKPFINAVSAQIFDRTPGAERFCLFRVSSLILTRLFRCSPVLGTVAVPRQCPHSAITIPIYIYEKNSVYTGCLMEIYSVQY